MTAWHVALCYSIIQQKFKYWLGQNFMVRTCITSCIRDFTVALVLMVYWELLSNLQRKICVTGLSSTCQYSIVQIYLCYTLKTWHYRTIQDPTFNLTVI